MIAIPIACIVLQLLVGAIAFIDMWRSLTFDKVLLPVVIEGADYTTITSHEGWRVHAWWNFDAPGPPSPATDGAVVLQLRPRAQWGPQ